jgi:hypothetical protein
MQPPIMFTPLPSTLLAFLFALPALSHASPQPALVSTDYEISLIPRHTLFLRQVSNLQTFSQALGGTPASAITNSGDKERPFSVDGDTFTDFDSAAQRSCDNQFQACQNAANGNGGGNQANTQSTNGGGGGNQANANGNKGGNGNGDKNGGNGNDNGKNNNNNNDGNKNGGNGGNNNNNNSQNGNNNNNKDKDRRQVVGNETVFEKRQNGGLTVNQCDQQKGKLPSGTRGLVCLETDSLSRSVQERTGTGDGQGLFDGGCEHEYWTRSAVSGF